MTIVQLETTKLNSYKLANTSNVTYLKKKLTAKYINRLKPMHKHYNKESKKVTLLNKQERTARLPNQETTNNI
jgi:hypothetical protein